MRRNIEQAFPINVGPKPRSDFRSGEDVVILASKNTSGTAVPGLVGVYSLKKGVLYAR